MASDAKLTPSRRKMLDRIRRASDQESGLLLLTIMANDDGRIVRDLLRAGLVERAGHSTIVSDGNKPAPVARITAAGRAALNAAEGGRDG